MNDRTASVSNSSPSAMVPPTCPITRRSLNTNDPIVAAKTRPAEVILAADGLDATDPHDVMTWFDDNFHQPCDLGRAGLPEEIASITTYLASRRNGYVTGATVNVDGGSDFV